MTFGPARLLLALLLSIAALAWAAGCTAERCRDDRGVEFYRERNAEWNRVMSPEHDSGDPAPYYDARGVAHQPTYP